MTAEETGAGARAPSEILPEELRATRRRKGWTQEQLADRLAELDAVTLKRPALAKIETGARGVSIDDAFWLATALGVSPLALLLPRSDQFVRVAPALPVRTSDAVGWVRGIYPLEYPADDASHRFFEEARPDYEAESIRRHPGVLELWRLAGFALFYAGYDEHPSNLERVLGWLSRDAATELEKVRRPGAREIDDDRGKGI